MLGHFFFEDEVLFILALEIPFKDRHVLRFLVVAGLLCPFTIILDFLQRPKSSTIKSKFIPLDISGNMYDVLLAIEKIEDGIRGNNITVGANQFSFFSQCLEGETKGQFEVLAKKEPSQLAISLLLNRSLLSIFAARAF